jgi:hypothetical protein
MKRIIAILLLWLAASSAFAQCDTTGILLELQATTNISGILLGKTKCIVPLKIGSGLTLSNDTLSASGGGGGGTNLTFTGSGPYTLNSSTGTDVTITQGTGMVITRTSNDLSFAAVDASTTNEIQTYAHTGTTSYTNTLSIGGGSFTLQSSGVLSLSHSTGTTTFALSNAGANTWLGNNTGGSAAPAYNSAGALTKTDDTNVTLTLGGTPATALLNAASLTLGWTGTLGVSRGGIGVGTITGIMQGNGTSAVTGITNSSTVGQTLRVTGTSAYAWGALDLANSAAITGDLPFANLTQGTARSVLAVTGNATADFASVQGTTDQVLRVNTAGTALAFGTVATGGITNSAITYAKIQNIAANNVVLGNIVGAGSVVQELTVANLYTLLGLSGSPGRNAFWTGTNTLSNSANWLWDNTNNRATITGTVAGSGANNAFMNLNSGAITGTTEFLRMNGNINGNMYALLNNTNNAGAANHTIFQIASGGASAGDAVVQFTVAGAMTHAIGIDNTDDRLKLTPNSSTPGGSVSLGVIIRDNSGVGNTGINNDFPVQPLTVEGIGRADLWIGEGNLYTAGNVAFGTGAGTGPSVGQIIGSGNSVMVTFTTGTTPAANGNIFTLTYPNSFPTKSIVVFSAGADAGGGAGDNAAGAITKFKIESSGAGTFVFKAVGTLAASTSYAVSFNFTGY